MKKIIFTLLLLIAFVLVGCSEEINLTDEDGHTDAVTGVSIKVGSYLDLVTQALEQTK